MVGFVVVANYFNPKQFIFSMARIQNKLEKAANCLEYFSTRQWRFLDDNVRMLNQSLSLDDRAEFSFDVKQIQWSKYIEDYVLGIRHFIFKENPNSLPAARKQLTKYVYLLNALCMCYKVLLLDRKDLFWKELVIGQYQILVQQIWYWNFFGSGTDTDSSKVGSRFTLPIYKKTSKYFNWANQYIKMSQNKVMFVEQLHASLLQLWNYNILKSHIFCTNLRNRKLNIRKLYSLFLTNLYIIRFM